MEMNGTTILGALLAVLATFVLSTEGVPFTRTLSDDELEHLGNYLNSISPKGSNDPYGWEKDFLSSGTPLDVYGGNMWGNFLKGVRSEPESEAVQPAMKRSGKRSDLQSILARLMAMRGSSNGRYTRFRFGTGK